MLGTYTKRFNNRHKICGHLFAGRCNQRHKEFVNNQGAKTRRKHQETMPKYDTIVLFYLYTKAHRENLSPEQLRRLRDAAAIIKQEFRA